MSSSMMPNTVPSFFGNPNAPLTQGGYFNFAQEISNNAQNPNNPGAGQVSDTALANDTFNNSSGNNTTQSTQSNPVALAAPQLLKTGAQQVASNSLFSGVTSQINSLGTQIGFGSGLTPSLGANIASPTAVGATDAYSAATAGAAETVSPAVASADAAATGGALTSATLSSTLGAAGLGAIGGSILASAIGGNPTGGAIGGGVGAAAGMAFGGAGAGALGLELGSFAGPIGAVVGGIGGALFGSMFGNSSAPTSDSSSSFSLGANGALTNIGGGSKNPSAQTQGFVQSAQTNFTDIATNVAQQLGIQFSPDVQFGASDSTLHGGPVISVANTKTGQSSGAIWFDPTNPTSVQNAYQQAIVAAAQFSGQDPTKVTQWFQNNYVNGTSQNGASNVAPTLSSNPSAQGSSAFQQFVQQYTAQQNANAAPTQTTVGTASNPASTPSTGQSTSTNL